MAESHEHEPPFRHVEASGQEGEGRGVTHVVKCSCGWKRRGDDYYWRDIRHAAWTNHVIDALLSEVARLGAHIGSQKQPDG